MFNNYLIGKMGLIVLTLSCSAQNDYIPEGRLLLNKPQKFGSIIYEDSMRVSNEIKYNPRKGYTTLMHERNSVIGLEYHITGEYGAISRSDIVQMDFKGNIERIIYSALPNEINHPEYLSWNDQLLLLTAHLDSGTTSSPIDEITPIVSVYVLNMKTGIRSLILKDVGRIPNLQIAESPWLHDNRRFVWSIDNNPRLIDTHSAWKKISSGELNPGVYITDIVTGQSELLIPNGEIPAVCPTQDVIAFVYNNAVYLYDFITKGRNLIFRAPGTDMILKYFWSPDGKHLYIRFRSKNENNKHIMISLDSLEEMEVENINIFNTCDSWKK